MPDAQARDIVERLDGMSPSIMAMRDGAREIRHLRFLVRSQADEIDRLTKELEEAREALRYIADHNNAFLTDGSGATRTCIDRLCEVARAALSKKDEANGR